MSESSTHSDLIRQLVKWVETQTEHHRNAALLADLPELRRYGSPPLIGGYVPDVFLKNHQIEFALIGEAKTPNDIETDHSCRQYLAFLTFLSRFPDNLFIAAVPWHCVGQMRSLISALQRKHRLQSVRTLFLDGL